MNFEPLRKFAQVLDQTESTGASGVRFPLTDALGNALKEIGECQRLRGKLIFIGNGGSAAIASHQAIDWWKNGGVRALSFSEGATLTCLGNDFGFAEVFERPVRMFAESSDLLIAISSSGRSENILRAVAAAREMRVGIITLSAFAQDNPLRQMGDLNFYLPTLSYGVAETGHLFLLHTLIEEWMKNAH